MYVTEAMIVSLEDTRQNFVDLERHIKGMMEIEARSHGLELDSRNNARDMWNELNAHVSSIAPAEADDGWVHPDETPVGTGEETPHANAEVEAPAMVEHTHEDGTTHAHEGGEEEHTHDDPATMMPEDEHGNPIAEGTPYRLDSEGLPIDNEGNRIAGIAPAPEAPAES